MSRHTGADETYDLFCVVVHLDVGGSTFFGHYVCHVRDASGSWWTLDDERAEPTTWDRVSEVNPYLLFYRRRSPHDRARPLPTVKKEAPPARPPPAPTTRPELDPPAAPAE